MIGRLFQDLLSIMSHSFHSSTSISMLPSEPKIFRGRESELSGILTLFSQVTPRMAILGAGGMEKTTLARAVVHHAEIIARYEQHWFFVSCGSAATKVELAALIGLPPDAHAICYARLTIQVTLLSASDIIKNELCLSASD